MLHGRGRIDVGERSFDVEPGDIVVVPSWAYRQVRADTEIDLFSTSDAPILAAIGLFRSTAG